MTSISLYLLINSIVSEVNPKKYFFMKGASLDIKIETSDRITHQLSTYVFYYFLHEVVGYAKVKVIYRPDNFTISNVIQRLTDTYSRDTKLP